MANIHTKTIKRLADNLFAEIQTGLSAHLPWLDNAYGKADRVQRVINERRYYEPVWYVGNDQYESLLPSQYNLGNYSFFVLNEPQTTDFQVWGQTSVTMPFSLIVWLDMRSVKNTYGDEYNTEAVKDDILQVLNGDIHTTAGVYTINRIWERAENVFEGFNVDETDQQMMMSPYAAFRFTGELIVKTICSTN